MCHRKTRLCFLQASAAWIKGHSRCRLWSTQKAEQRDRDPDSRESIPHTLCHKVFNRWGGAMFSTDDKCSKETWSIVTEFALSARTTSLCNLILHVNINCKGFFLVGVTMWLNVLCFYFEFILIKETFHCIGSCMQTKMKRVLNVILK